MKSEAGGLCRLLSPGARTGYSVFIGGRGKMGGRGEVRPEVIITRCWGLELTASGQLERDAAG